VNIEFENEFELKDVMDMLKKTPGVIVEDDIKNQIYPMPMNAHTEMKSLLEGSEEMKRRQRP
jgi:aspartate-semialdehyde dehydrogenase